MHQMRSPWQFVTISVPTPFPLKLVQLKKQRGKKVQDGQILLKITLKGFQNNY